MTTKKTRKTNTSKIRLENDQKTLERLKKKLIKLEKERETMSNRYTLLIEQEQDESKRPLSFKNAEKNVRADYQYLSNRINSVKAEILSIEGGVITKEVLPWVLGEQPKRGGFGRNFGLKSSYEMNGKTYQYKEGDIYFQDKIGANELQILNAMPDDTPKGDKYNLGDIAEGGEMSDEFEDTALKTNFYQELQIKNNESKLNRTYTNGTF